MISVVLTLISLLSLTKAAIECPTLTLGDIETGLQLRVNADEPGSVVSWVSTYIQCRAQGYRKNYHRAISAILKFWKTTNGGIVTKNNVKQIEMRCNLNAYTWSVDNVLSDVPSSFDYVNAEAWNNCSDCQYYASNDHHCLACDLECNAGLMRCSAFNGASCCAAFDDNGSCLPTTTSCSKPGYVSTQESNWECVCGYPCGAGYGPNAACNGCDLTNICLANNPCMNGGDCTLHAPPDSYTCFCTNDYTGPTCSVCGLSCGSGYTINNNCSECVLSDICKANSPCLNGGTCVLESAPSQFSCMCIDHYTPSSNCSERPLTTGSEMMSDNPETYKSEYARTCFDVNNQGKVILKDEDETLTILMCP